MNSVETFCFFFKVYPGLEKGKMRFSAAMSHSFVQNLLTRLNSWDTGKIYSTATLWCPTHYVYTTTKCISNLRCFLFLVSRLGYGLMLVKVHDLIASFKISFMVRSCGAHIDLSIWNRNKWISVYLGLTQSTYWSSKPDRAT